MASGNTAVRQSGNMAAWRYALPKRMAKNKSRQIVQLQSKASQLASPPLPPSSPLSKCVADFGSKWHGHICRFTGPRPCPPPHLCAVPRYVCIIFIPRMPWQRLCCMWHSPAQREVCGGVYLHCAGLHILATALTRNTTTTKGITTTTAGKATTDNGK